MGYQSYNIRVCAAIFACVLLHFPYQMEAIMNPAELIGEVCDQSQLDKKFCVQSLISNPKTAIASDVKTLAKIALKNAREESAKTSDFFHSLLDKLESSTDSVAKESIKQCANYFAESMGMLNLRGLDGDTASLDVHYALDNAEYCETALEAARVHVESIAPAILRWKKCFSVAYAAVLAVENSEN